MRWQASQTSSGAKFWGISSLRILFGVPLILLRDLFNLPRYFLVAGLSDSGGDDDDDDDDDGVDDNDGGGGDDADDDDGIDDDGVDDNDGGVGDIDCWMGASAFWEAD
jgi:hypothetical protein